MGCDAAQLEDTPLLFASHHGFDDVIKLLLSAGARVNASGKVRLYGCPTNVMT